MRGWRPDWMLEPSPAGEDEVYVEDYYYTELGTDFTVQRWEDLEEWKREAWRREFRNG